ncbi:MAG: hypothetical protein KDD43_02125, partial [Bdellovibrionales bacterium]|nr:hypothetical protein [Bdellovibrionales bacterium]
LFPNIVILVFSLLCLVPLFTTQHLWPFGNFEMFAHKWEPGVLEYLLIYDLSEDGSEKEWGRADYRPYHGYLMNLMLTRVEQQSGDEGLKLALSQLSTRRQRRGRGTASVGTRLYRVRHPISLAMGDESMRERTLVLEVSLP